jgi:[ribosomal protein S5]-alanine N-acetyltransferase
MCWCFGAVPKSSATAARRCIACARPISIADIRSAYLARKQVTWAITPRGHGSVLGEVSIFNWNRRHHRAEISYALARASWGQGIASEAVRAVIRFGIARMVLHRIEAVTLVKNARSVRLLERLGFEREGTRREYSLEEDGAYLDSAIYGLLDPSVRGE